MLNIENEWFFEGGNINRALGLAQPKTRDQNRQQHQVGDQRGDHRQSAQHAKVNGRDEVGQGQDRESQHHCHRGIVHRARNAVVAACNCCPVIPVLDKLTAKAVYIVN